MSVCYIYFSSTEEKEKKKKPRINKYKKMSATDASLPPIPTEQAFISAITASIQKSQNAGNLQLVKATVFARTDRRGCAYIDCNSSESAAEVVKICQEFPPQFSEESQVDSFFRNRGPLIVAVKAPTNTNPSTSTLLVTYTHQPSNVIVAANNGNDNADAAAAAPEQQDQKQNINSNNNNGNNKNNNASLSIDTTNMTVAPPLYVRCKRFSKIHHIFDFFRAKDIAGHALDCVYCASSKKPYFLVEWGKNVDSFRSCLWLDGISFEGEDVSIKVSTQSAAEYREKKPESLSLAAKRETKIRQREEEDTDLLNGVGAMVPISVLMKANNNVQSGPTVPPNEPTE